MPEMDAPRALVFRPLVKGNEALGTRLIMTGKMAIAAALPGFNDLGRSVTPTFLSRNRFYSQLSPHRPKMNKRSMWEVKKIQDFCPWDIESCHLAAARRAKLWSLNTNLFFKEPH